MTANPELTPQQRLDAMVEEKHLEDNGSPMEPWVVDGPVARYIDAAEAVALDLLSKLDAAEAQVESLKLETKALTAERDERIKQLHLLLCEVQVNWPCTVYNNLLWGDILRRIDAALKGESHD